MCEVKCFLIGEYLAKLQVIRTKNRYDALEMESDPIHRILNPRIHLNLFTMSYVIQWNIRGLQANREELSMLLSDFDPTLVCLQKNIS